MTTSRSGISGRLLRVIAFAVLSVSIASRGHAWGQQGHFMVNLAATSGTPTAMPQFFRDAFPRLAWLGYDPDRWRGAGESLDAVNPPEHFLDYEYVAGLSLPPDRYEFIEMLEESGTLRLQGISITTPGFLPWRVAEVSQLLEREWKIWLTADLAADERRQVEESIIFNAGILGHYVADGANPHHATIHYNGWVAMNTDGYANDCEIHFRFETAFVTRAVDVADLFPAVAEPVLRTNYFSTALDLIRDSHSRVEDLYRLDRGGAFTGMGSDEGRAFAVSRLARGASVLRDLWWSSWVNAAKSK